MIVLVLIVVNIILVILIALSWRARRRIIETFDSFENALVRDLTQHTVPQRLMEHFRSTLANQSEQFVAFDERFAYDPKDARFLGSPVDLVIFNGRSNGSIEEVVFVEVKQHAGVQLTHAEKSLRAAIEAGNVRWERFDLRSGSGITRKNITSIGAQDLELDISRTVREHTLKTRRDLRRITKLL